MLDVRLHLTMHRTFGLTGYDIGVYRAKGRTD